MRVRPHTLEAVLVLATLLAVGCKKPVPPEDAVSVRDVPVEPPPPKKVEEAPPAPQPDTLARVGFALDSSSVSRDAANTLDRDARVLQAHAGVRVEVQGHCDDRGTTDYNLALGERRASAVKRYLVAQGVAPSALTTVSYGEEKPLALGEDEDAWAANRRAELRVTSSGDGLVVGTTP